MLDVLHCLLRPQAAVFITGWIHNLRRQLTTRAMAKARGWREPDQITEKHGSHDGDLNSRRTATVSNRLYAPCIFSATVCTFCFLNGFLVRVCSLSTDQKFYLVPTSGSGNEVLEIDRLSCELALIGWFAVGGNLPYHIPIPSNFTNCCSAYGNIFHPVACVCLYTSSVFYYSASLFSSATFKIYNARVPRLLECFTSIFQGLKYIYVMVKAHGCSLIAKVCTLIA